MNSTKIFVRDFKIDALAGIYPGDDVNPIPLSVTVEVTFGDWQVAADSIDSTMSYELLADEIRRISKIHFHLVEKLAEHLADFCLGNSRVSSALVRVEKMKIFPEGPAGTEIIRTRA